jgi:hypothetical protein
MKAAVAFIGSSGSGKTLSMLLVAYGMMKEEYPELESAEVFKKIGMIDTEHNRGQIYAGTTVTGIKIEPFYHIDLQAPYSVERYSEAMMDLKNAGCEVVIVDSISHAWEGQGGMLDLKEQFGGTFSSWRKVKPYMEKFVRDLTANNVHVLASMRTKQDYQVETGDTGKLNIKKIGLKPVMKDDLEYEFMIVWRIDQSHVAQAVKDNSNLFESDPGRLTPEQGAKLFRWLDEGIDVKAEEEAKRQEIITYINDVRSDEAIENVVKQLEFKAKCSITDMSLKLLERALNYVKNQQQKQNQQTA